MHLVNFDLKMKMLRAGRGIAQVRVLPSELKALGSKLPCIKQKMKMLCYFVYI
jgi:hypothetical protein